MRPACRTGRPGPHGPAQPPATHLPPPAWAPRADRRRAGPSLCTTDMVPATSPLGQVITHLLPVAPTQTSVQDRAVDMLSASLQPHVR